MSNGFCTICEDFEKYFSLSNLEAEISLVQELLKEEQGKCMVGISGGKDSTATLLTLLDRGAVPLSFTFDIGYDPLSTYTRSHALAQSLNILYERIDIKKYIGSYERACYEQLVMAYDLPDSLSTQELFRYWYLSARNHYSVRDRTVLPYVRPCQLCRKVVIKAYYQEAVQRGVKLIFLGMNERTHLSTNGKYSAIRKLQPFEGKPPVYIIHFPFLVRRTLQQTQEILQNYGWEPPLGDTLVETNHNSCLLAAATEKRFFQLLGFHPDCMRLSREVTVGFLPKEVAYEALQKFHEPNDSLTTILTSACIL